MLNPSAKREVSTSGHPYRGGDSRFCCDYKGVIFCGKETTVPTPWLLHR